MRRNGMIVISDTTPIILLMKTGRCIVDGRT